MEGNPGQSAIKLYMDGLNYASKTSGHVKQTLLWRILWTFHPAEGQLIK